METIESMRLRYSCRDYKKQQISKEELEILLKAANVAPVALGNYNDVAITVIQNEEVIQEISNEAARVMSGLGSNPVYSAPTLLMISAMKGSEMPESVSYCNASCIAENIMLAATDIGLASTYLLAVSVVIQHNKSICEKLGIPEDFMPITTVATGYANDKGKEKDLENYRIRTNYIA